MKLTKLSKALLFFSLFILPLFTARADDLDIPEEEVVVTATRTEETQLESPGMTEVIDAEKVQASGATNVSELLAKEGFVVSSYSGASGAATFRLDGCDATQTLVLVNGIPANSGTIGTVDLSYFPTAGISKIEVAHGPLSSLYGSGALGGVVNIITDLTGEPLNSVSMAYGTTDRSKADSGNAAVSIRRNNYGLTFGGGRDDGFRANSKSENYFLLYQYDFIQKEDEALSLHLQSMAKKNRLPGPVYQPTPEDDQSDKKHALSLVGKKIMPEGLWEYKVYGDYWHQTSYTFGENDDYRFRNYGMDLAGLYVWGRHEALFGINAVNSHTDSTDYGEHRLTNTGVFMQDSWSVAEQWKLISGLRWDNGGKYSSPVCPRVGLVYLADDHFSLKFGYGKAFRSPTISDLYFPYGGNPDLKPETGERYDITGEWRNNMHTVSLNVYQSKLKDGIDWIRVGPNDWDWAVQNFQKVRVTGANINWQAEWSDYLNSNVKYCRNDKEKWNPGTDSYNEDNFFGRNKLTLGLNFKRAAVSSNLNWEYVWDRSDQSAHEMEDYDAINWNLAYTFKGLVTYKLSINNLADKDYEIHYGYPVSEREYKISCSYAF